MSNNELQKLAIRLNQSEQYRVITKYKKPDFYTLDDNSEKLIGVFLDIESTGLSYRDDKLIELGMVKFEYTVDGRIFCILDEFHAYQDPNCRIPDFITQLTGISNDMVNGRQIDHMAVASYLANVDLIIAHNAEFDRAFFESTFPDIKPKAWACSMYDINWNSEKIESHKLEYIAYKYNFFYEGHRAITDCLVGIHILSQQLYNSKQLVLKELLSNALQPRFKLWTKNAAYEHKDKLRSRRYKWGTHPTEFFKAWFIELPENKVAAEIDYLKTEIYNGRMNIPIDIVDAYDRFSIKPPLVTTNATAKYLNKLDWVNTLQNPSKQHN